MDKTPFVLLVSIRLKPGCADEYLSIVNPVNDAMRYEPTFVNTVLHQAADDPNLFILHETWLDQDDFFAVQMKRPYRAEYEARLPALLSQPREMKVLRPIRSDFAVQDGASQPSAGQVW